MLYRTMNVPNEQIAQASPSIFDAQKNDLEKTIRVLKSIKQDLNPSWAKENVDQTIEMVEQKKTGEWKYE